MDTLKIEDLYVDVIPEDDDKHPIEILKGVNLSLSSGETHAVMGPNGSGKSTLSYAIAGHPRYKIKQGRITLNKVDITNLPVDERAKAGIFLAMQYPVEIPGVSTMNFLRSAATSLRGTAPNIREWVQETKRSMQELQIEDKFSNRGVNEGFSGGEKKRHEVLQLSLLKPKFAILDETDSGLDVDALKIVSEGVNRYQERENGGILLITHYTRILKYIKPDRVHVFVNGKVVESAGPELANELEENGYNRFVSAN